jgi:hypothetical protein
MDLRTSIGLRLAPIGLASHYTRLCYRLLNPIGSITAPKINERPNAAKKTTRASNLTRGGTDDAGSNERR